MIQTRVPLRAIAQTGASTGQPVPPVTHHPVTHSIPYNLVAFIDGTGCFLGKTCSVPLNAPCETSVARLWRDITNISHKQLTFYSSGAGTHNVTLDYATGATVDDSAWDAYRFYAQNFQEGDKLFAFGHSRGTLSVRYVQGMVHRLGVAKPEFVEKAIQLYRDDNDAKCAEFKASSESRVSSFEFVGIFEGVLRTLFLPIDTAKYHLEIASSTKNLAHAMALGEWRRMYEVNELLVEPETSSRQVWFFGQHGNMGGNAVDRGVSDIPLGWMVDEARKSGLEVPDGWAANTLHQDVQADLRGDRPVVGIDSTGWALRNPVFCREETGRAGQDILVHQSVKDRMSLVPGWVPQPWCCSNYANYMQDAPIAYVTNDAYEAATQKAASSNLHWVKLKLGHLRNAHMEARDRSMSFYVLAQTWHSSIELPERARVPTGTSIVVRVDPVEGATVEREPDNNDLVQVDFGGAEVVLTADPSVADQILIEVYEKDNWNTDDLVGRFAVPYNGADATQMKARHVKAVYEWAETGCTFEAQLELFQADAPVQSALGDASAPAQCTWLLNHLLDRSEEHMCSPVFDSCDTFRQDVWNGAFIEEAVTKPQ